MNIKLSDDLNPYAAQSPFDILGVSASASKREVLDAYNEKLEQVDDDFEGEERIIARERIRRAYDAVREAKSRVSVEIFFYDSNVGQQDCRDCAARYASAKLVTEKVFEGSDRLFPTSPDVRHAKSQLRKVKFDESTRLNEAANPFEVPATERAISSMTFDT